MNRAIITQRVTLYITLFIWLLLTISSGIMIISYLLYLVLRSSNIIHNDSTTTPCIGINCSPNSKGSHGAISSDHVTCSRIGQKIIQKYRGNAMDAAVTVGLCIGVTVPWSSGIGGGSVMLFRSGQGEMKYYDGRETAPDAAFAEMFDVDPEMAQRGGLAVAVPGELLALYEAHQDHGRLDWKDLFADVILLADAQIVTSTMAEIIARVDKLGAIDKFDGFREIYKPDGVILKEGDVLRMPRLARTLERIRDDPLSFYNGSLAHDIAQDVQDAGGVLTEQDLSKYSVRKRDGALCTKYLGYDVCGAFPQIAGGATIGLGLNYLEPFNSKLSKSDFRFQTIEAMKFGFGHRNFLGDPDFEDVEEITKDMMDKDYAGSLRNKQDNEDVTNANISHYTPEDYMVNHPNNHGTTHFSIIDDEGSVVSMTTTINLYFGSMVIGKRTGILFNDEMDDFSMKNASNAFGLPPSPRNFIAPQKRPLSSMSPTIVLKDNKVRLVVGAAGGPIIISATFQVILNVLTHGMDLKRAVEMPRLHHQLVPPLLLVENTWSKEAQKKFADWGHDVMLLEFKKHEYLGIVEAVEVIDGPDGQPIFHSVADWRKGISGTAAW